MPLQDVEKLKDQANAAHARGDLDSAIDLITQAIRACNSRNFTTGQPGDEEASKAESKRNHLLSILYSNRAALWAMNQHYVQSLVDAKHAIANDGTWPKPYLRKATALLGLGQPHAALRVLDRGVAACSEASWQLESVRSDVEVAAAMQQRNSKRMRPLPPLLHVHQSAKVASGTSDAAKAAVPRAVGAAATVGQQERGPESEAGPAARPSEDGIQGGPELVAFALDLLDQSARALGRVPGPQREEHKVPITVISGFLGAGKTTLLQRILTEGAGALSGESRGPVNTSTGNGGSNTSTGQNNSAGDCGLSHGNGPQDTGQSHTHGNGDSAAVSNKENGDNAVPQPSAQQRSFSFGVVVNDMASVNIDGTLAQDAAAARMLSHVAPGDRDSDSLPAQNVVEMSNGCICCGLKGDMLLEVAQLLSTSPSINYLVIESTGVGQPMPIAAAFASPDHRGRSLLEYVRLDCLVTVVDAPRFMEDMKATHTPETAAAAARLLRVTSTEGPLDAQTPAAPPPDARLIPEHTHEGHDHMLLDAEDNRPLAELLTEQIEFADVVILNKVDAASLAGQGQSSFKAPGGPLDVQLVKDRVYGLNPRAHIVTTSFCECPLTEVINTHRFDFAVVSESARWQQELLAPRSSSSTNATEHDHAHETAVYGIQSMVYEARRPFHPGRLREWLNVGLLAALQPTADLATANAIATLTAAEVIQPQLPAQLLRSKGFFWLASCPQVAWEWSTAGAAGRLVPYSEWLAGKLPRRCFPTPGRRAGWDDIWGDRCTSLVFITHGPADLSVIKPGLDSCLLTDEEINVPIEEHLPTAPELPVGGSGAAADGEKDESEEEEEGVSEDNVWFQREQAWEKLPGAAAWAALMQD